MSDRDTDSSPEGAAPAEGGPPPGGRRLMQACFLLAAIGVAGWLLYRSPLGREWGVKGAVRLGAVSVPLLRHAMWDENSDVRAAARNGLFTLGTAATPSLLKTLGESDARLRIQSLQAFAVIGPAGPEVETAVVRRLGDKDVDVRCEALTTLSVIGSQNATAIDAVAGAMSDPAAAVRRYAAQMLPVVDLKGTVAIPVLLKALKDADIEVRFEAIVSLGRFGPRTPEIIPALQASTRDMNPAVREEASEVLAKIEPGGRTRKTSPATSPVPGGAQVSTAGSSDAAPRVERISPEANETEVAVHVGRISLETMRHYVSAYGRVEPEPGTKDRAAASARIFAPATGLVAEVKCHEGQRVEKGQPLLTLAGREADAKSLPPITAPLSGTVVFVGVRPGEAINPFNPTLLVEVVDMRRLVVAARIPASQLAKVKAGQAVEIFVPRDDARDSFDPAEAAPDAEAPGLGGKVAFVEDFVDPKTDTGTVDVSIPADSPLRPGQFVRVRVVTGEQEDCLTVPARSVVKNEAGEWVISLIRGKWATQYPVRLGFREGGKVQVIGRSLKPGDEVVTTGAYGLPRQAKIRIIPE